MRTLYASATATLRRSRVGLTQSIMAMGGQAGAAVAGVLTSVILARTLAPSDLGTYALVASVVAFANGLSDMGIMQTAIRFGSRAFSAGDERGLRSIVRWGAKRRFALAAAVVALGATAGPLLAMAAWHAPDAAWLIPVALLSTFASQIGANVSSQLQACSQFGRNSLASLVGSAVGLVGLLCVLALRSVTVPSVVIAGVASTMIAGLAIQLFVPAPSRIWNLPREHSTVVPSEVAPFARMMVLTAVSAQLLLNADLWVLAAVVPREEVATYSLAARFTLPLSLAAAAIGSVLWPRIGALSGAGSTRELGERLLRMASVGAVPIAAYSVLVPLLAPYLFGRQYSSSILLGQVLCSRYAIALFGTVLTGVGYNLGLGAYYPLLNLGRTLVLAMVGVSFAQRLGAMSFALGVVASEAFLVGSVLLMVRRKLRSLSY